MRKSDRHSASAIDTSKRPSHTLRKDVVAEIANRRKLSNTALEGSRPRHAAPSGPAQESSWPVYRRGLYPDGVARLLIATKHTETLAKISASSIKRAVERDIPQTPLWDIGDFSDG
jgi:hypothetical protein